jgi:hypothetical protein
VAIDHRHVVGAAVGLVAIRVAGARVRLAVSHAVRRAILRAAVLGDDRQNRGVAIARVAVRVADAWVRLTVSDTRRQAIARRRAIAFAAFADTTSHELVHEKIVCALLVQEVGLSSERERGSKRDEVQELH